MSAVDRAMAWREQMGYQDRGGYIVVFEEKVQGWASEFPEPQQWVPGSVAVAEDKTSWTAIIGDDVDGSLMWLPNDLV